MGCIVLWWIEVAIVDFRRTADSRLEAFVGTKWEAHLGSINLLDKGALQVILFFISRVHDVSIAFWLILAFVLWNLRFELVALLGHLTDIVFILLHYWFGLTISSRRLHLIPIVGALMESLLIEAVGIGTCLLGNDALSHLRYGDLIVAIFT